MFDRIKEGRTKYGLRLYLRREISRQLSRRFFRVTERSLAKGFQELGIEPGITVCVHSALSKLGYVENGAESVIRTLMNAVSARQGKRAVLEIIE